MFRALTALAILVFSRVIGVYSPGDSIATSINNAVFGGTSITSSSSGANQVLSLMSGPQGPPGPAGVTTGNTFTGLNAYVGKDGIPGAPGPVGPQGPAGATGPQGEQGPAGPQGAQGDPGASVAVISIDPVSAPDNHCPNGGAKLIAPDGKVTYICNGAPGAPGSNGANGRDGAPGSGSTTSVTGGSAQLSAGGCGSLDFNAPFRDLPNPVMIPSSGSSPGNYYFMYNSLDLTNISSACSGADFTVTVKLIGPRFDSHGNIADPDVKQQLNCVATLPRGTASYSYGPSNYSGSGSGLPTYSCSPDSSNPGAFSLLGGATSGSIKITDIPKAWVDTFLIEIN